MHVSSHAIYVSVLVIRELSWLSVENARQRQELLKRMSNLTQIYYHLDLSFEDLQTRYPT